MKQELDINYEISVHDMLNMEKEHTTAYWKIRDAEFFSPTDFDLGRIQIRVLTNGVDIGTSGAKQIFRMNDGKFILEVEEGLNVDYFYSENLIDLL